MITTALNELSKYTLLASDMSYGATLFTKNVTKLGVYDDTPGRNVQPPYTVPDGYVVDFQLDDQCAFCNLKGISE